MKFPITQKRLIDWAGPNVFRDAETLYKKGLVQEATYEPPFIKGAVSWANRDLKTRLRILPDGNVENNCPCRDSVERGIICSHVIALGIVLVKRNTDPQRDDKYHEELRRAKRLAQIDENQYIQRAEEADKRAPTARLVITLASGWRETPSDARIPVICQVESGGKRMNLEDVPRDVAYRFAKQDETLLFTLEDICEGPARSEIDVRPPDFINVLKLWVGRQIEQKDGPEITVNAAELDSHIRMDLDRENGEIILMVHTELPFLETGEFPYYITSANEGWTYGSGHFWPLTKILPGPLRSIYAEPIAVARDAVPRFMRSELPMISEYMPIESDISEDLFTIEPGTPRFRLHLKGSPASLSATVEAVYDDHILVAAKSDPKGHFSIPDPQDLMRYLVRNKRVEKIALERLAKLGFSGPHGEALSSIVGSREVMNFLASGMPLLRREGWRVELEGRIAPHMEQVDFVTPVVHVNDGGGNRWFEVSFSFEDSAGASLSAQDIQRAIIRGDCFIERDGRTLLLDADAIQSMNDVFADCSSAEGSQAGSFRLDHVYSAFVKSSLDALDGIDVEAGAVWRDKARSQNRGGRPEPVALGEPLDGILRGYQKEGVSWLRFLESNYLGGILADEMGLGKTLQTLAWLQLKRIHDDAGSKPALIVAPTSLVENWQDEAARFTPELQVLAFAGPDRHKLWDDVPSADIVVTSYALLRRDLEKLLEVEFSCAILDEAQHIKNHSTQNAIAAKQIQAEHRLVLTGTPIENSVSDLWSIMDFLMPGYLGAHSGFRQNYELPIQNGGPDGQHSQNKLRRKVHPFLLRRLKSEVARDLPPKIEKISACTMSPDQKMVYMELLETSRRKIKEMVKAKGFNSCRMEILSTLTKLRQVCCHLELLKMPDLNSKAPSAKLELFLELLNEALDGGHRVLVFSQFVSMLTILRRELEEQDLTYCYLDGSTKKRLDEVKRFNTDRSIPIFLISLKAGGTGLNLTGADMVVHFDPWWNPAVENQATDRAYRIGQKRTVYSHKLITRGTVEEKVVEMQKRKQAIIDATLENDEAMMQKLSWEDIQSLLEI